MSTGVDGYGSQRQRKDGDDFIGKTGTALGYLMLFNDI